MKHTYIHLPSATLRKLEDNAAVYEMVGEKMSAMYFHYEKGYEHTGLKHANEEFVYIIEGHLKAEISNDHYDLKKGDAALIPSKEHHKIFAVEKTIVLAMFAPPITNDQAKLLKD